MAKKQIGKSRVVSVKSHKRNVPGRLKRKKIKKFKRRQKYWGPAKSIKKKLIYRLALLFDLKSQRDVDKYFSRIIFGNKETFIHTWQKLPEIIHSAVIGGMQNYEEDFLERVPQKSGLLRKRLMESISSNEPKKARGGKMKFPYMMRVEVDLKYAGIVENYDKSVQLQHSSGRNFYKGRTYFADKGDPNAEHNFWTRFPTRMRMSTKKAIEEEAKLFNFSYGQVTYFLLDSPPFL